MFALKARRSWLPVPSLHGSCCSRGSRHTASRKAPICASSALFPGTQGHFPALEQQGLSLAPLPRRIVGFNQRRGAAVTLMLSPVFTLPSSSSFSITRAPHRGAAGGVRIRISAPLAHTDVGSPAGEIQFGHRSLLISGNSSFIRFPNHSRPPCLFLSIV
jgi:hypothetical protein